jgi:hypothetical protein
MQVLLQGEPRAWGRKGGGVSRAWEAFGRDFGQLMVYARAWRVGAVLCILYGWALAQELQLKHGKAA